VCAATLTDGSTITLYNPFDDEECHALSRLYLHYLVEEQHRTGSLALSLPAASYLTTTLLHRNDQIVGFMSVDVGRRAVELIFVEPLSRGRRIATSALVGLRENCPGAWALKAPLSSGGEVLARRLGLSRVDPTPEEEALADAAARMVRRMVERRCKHKGPRGNPQRMCRRCQEAWLIDYAATVVVGHANECRRVGPAMAHPGGLFFDPPPVG
jgi:hypothetical protein